MDDLLELLSKALRLAGGHPEETWPIRVGEVVNVCVVVQRSLPTWAVREERAHRAHLAGARRAADEDVVAWALQGQTESKGIERARLPDEVVLVVWSLPMSRDGLGVTSPPELGGGHRVFESGGRTGGFLLGQGHPGRSCFADSIAHGRATRKTFAMVLGSGKLSR